MGMYCELQAVSPDLLERLKADPAFTVEFFNHGVSSELDDLVKAFPGGAPPELQQLLNSPKELLKLVAPPTENLQNYDFTTGAGPKLELEKSWNGLHFLLTGSQWEGEPPLSFTVMGKDNLIPADENDRNWSYGPPRFVPPETVKEIDAALKATDFESLWNSRDFTSPENDLYAFHPDDLEEEKEWLGTYFNQLCEFYESAAASNSAVVMIID